VLCEKQEHETVQIWLCEYILGNNIGLSNSNVLQTE